MNVLYLNNKSSRGGASRSFVEMVNELHEFGINPYVLTSKINGVNTKLAELGIENNAIGYHEVLLHNVRDWYVSIPLILLRGLQYYIQFHPSRKKGVQFCEKKKIELIHSNTVRVDTGCALANYNKLPNILHLREFGKEDYNCITLRPHFVDYYNKHVTRFIAISKAVKNAWINHGIDENKISVVYNGVASDKSLPALTWKGNPDRLRLCIVGNVIETKGQLQIVQAISKLPPEIRDNVSLDIIGYAVGSYKHKIVKAAVEGGIIRNVRFLGERDDVYNCLHNCHVGLTCSRAEGFGRVTVEYLNAGLCVIATNAGANPEIIQDNINGLLYELDDIDDLARQIAKIYQNPGNAYTLSKNGQRIARERFTPRHNAKGIHEVYCQVMASR